MRVRITLLTAALAAWAIVAGPGAGRAEPVKIRLSWVVAPPVLSPFLFTAPGTAKHYGVTYTVESQHFPGTPTMITALAAGELDIATLGFSTLATAVQNAGMSDIRIIGDEFQDGFDDYYSSRYLVSKDGPIKTVEDLKGKVVASNGIGSGIDMPMRAMLRLHGLEDHRDYSVVEVNFANMRAMLVDKKADLIMLGAGFAYEPTVTDASRILFTMKDAMKGPAQQSMWTARSGFIAKNRAALVDFMEDALRGLHWYLDPANRAQAIEIVSKFSHIPPERLGWALTHQDYYRAPDGLPNIPAIKSNIAVQKDLGLIKADLDVDKYVDLSLMKEAGQRLK